VVFDSFANWCTCKEGNGMFQNYTNNYKAPNGQKSKIYIIINNEFFSGKLNDDTLYQIHFESSQVKDRKNTTDNRSIFDTVLVHSDGLSNYFHDELIDLSKMVKSVGNNLYLNYLIKFGFSDSLFEVIEDTTPIIIFKNREVPKMGDLSRFRNLETLEMHNTKLVSIHPSVFSLPNLEVMVVRDNKLTTLPSEIGNLKSLIFLNILGNKIIDIPDTIKYLDKSNGGSLHRVAVNINEIGVENYNKLKRLLPNTIIMNPQ
jgi:Leucine-rich repeat (LRR) protein